MTAERSEAYGRVMRGLKTFLGEATDDEIARIREACDALVLACSESPRDRHAITVAIVVLADLAERGAISRESAARMVHDIGRCAPPKGASPDDEDTTPLAA
jgi:hypothetical protein